MAETIPDVAPATAKYLQEAGWPAYIGSLHANPQNFVRLVEIPYVGLAACKKREEERWIEKGLYVCHQANFIYVRSAIEFAFRQHHDLWSLLVQG
jgi:hypothetical protein